MKIKDTRLSAALLLICFFSAGTATAQEAEVKLFAHRGGSYEFDENTLEAFRSSYESGMRGYETDIRITKDGELVMFHDSSVERMTGQQGNIEEMTSEEIRKLKTKKGNPILFLDEFLAYFKDKKGVYIEFEMKTNKPVYDEARLKKYCDMLYSKVIAARPEGSDYVFTSFDKRPLRYLKSTYADVELLFIKSEGLSESLIAELKELGVTRIGCRLGGTTREMVETAREQGITVSLWPGHTINDFLLGIHLGADYLCSDIPVEVSKWVKENQPWIRLK